MHAKWLNYIDKSTLSMSFGLCLVVTRVSIKIELSIVLVLALVLVFFTSLNQLLSVGKLGILVFYRTVIFF